MLPPESNMPQRGQQGYIHAHSQPARPIQSFCMRKLVPHAHILPPYSRMPQKRKPAHQRDCHNFRRQERNYVSTEQEGNAMAAIPPKPATHLLWLTDLSPLPPNARLCVLALHLPGHQSVHHKFNATSVPVERTPHVTGVNTLCNKMNKLQMQSYSPHHCIMSEGRGSHLTRVCY